MMSRRVAFLLLGVFLGGCEKSLEPLPQETASQSRTNTEPEEKEPANETSGETYAFDGGERVLFHERTFDVGSSESLGHRLQELGWKPMRAPTQQEVRLPSGMSVGSSWTFVMAKPPKRAVVMLKYGHFEGVHDPLVGAAKGQVGEMVTLVVLVHGDGKASRELYQRLAGGSPDDFPTVPLP